MANYQLTRLPAKTLATFDLIDIEYPMPKIGFRKFVSVDTFDPGMILYWLQEYSEGVTDSWQQLEPAMQRLSEQIAADRFDAIDAFLEGSNWRLKIGCVDLSREIVTIQRNNHLLAAIQNQGDGKLIVAAYRPLDAKSITYLSSLALNPAPDGTVCMRPSNWEYALDHSAGTGNIYAAERGEAYLSYWEYGLGVFQDNSIEREWHRQRDMMPIGVKFVASQIETYFGKIAEIQLAYEEKKRSQANKQLQGSKDLKWHVDPQSGIPQGWGLRGDPYLWEVLNKSLMEFQVISSHEYKERLESEFLKIVGVPVTHKEDVYVEQFAHGGMSSGYISMSFWRECGIPTLIDNFERSLYGARQA